MATLQTQIDNNIVEGTEYGVYLNGKLIETGVCEYEGQVEDLVSQIALSLHLESSRRNVNIIAKAV